MQNSFIKSIPLLSFDTSTLTTSYQVVNSAGLPKACFSMTITNNSSAVITISFDGTIANEVILANSSKEFFRATGDKAQNYMVFFPKYQKFYVKAAAAQTGALYISGYYL